MIHLVFEGSQVGHQCPWFISAPPLPASPSSEAHHPAPPHLVKPDPATSRSGASTPRLTIVLPHLILPWVAPLFHSAPGAHLRDLSCSRNLYHTSSCPGPPRPSHSIGALMSTRSSWSRPPLPPEGGGAAARSSLLKPPAKTLHNFLKSASAAG